MKKVIVAVLVALLLAPSFSYAQVADAQQTTLEELKAQLIALLTEQVALLRAQIAELKSEQEEQKKETKRIAEKVDKSNTGGEGAVVSSCAEDLDLVVRPSRTNIDINSHDYLITFDIEVQTHCGRPSDFPFSVLVNGTTVRRDIAEWQENKDKHSADLSYSYSPQIDRQSDNFDTVKVKFGTEVYTQEITWDLQD